MWPAGWLSSTSGLDVEAGNVLQDVNLQPPLRNQSLCSYVAACQPASPFHVAACQPATYLISAVGVVKERKQRGVEVAS